MTHPPPAVEVDGHLLARLSSLRSDIDHLDEAIRGLTKWGPQLARPGEMAEIQRRLKPAIVRKLNEHRDALDQLQADEANSPAESWTRLEQLTGKLVPVIAEGLLLVEGAFLRASGFDGGLCRLADCLLDEIAEQAVVPWRRTVLPADREQANPGTWLIGWRFPDFSIWSLPLMAHELGHFATSHLEDASGERPVETLLAGGWTEDEVRRALVPYYHAKELFADAFGAFVLGPAYAASLIWRAFAAGPWSDRGLHPGWGWRVRGALTVLEEIPGCAWAAEQLLEPRWQQSLDAAGAPEPPAKTASAIDAFCWEALSCLKACAPEARFETCQQALTIELHALQRGPHAITKLCRAEGWTDNPGRVVSSILNAVWLHRMRQAWDADVAPAGQSGLDACVLLVDGRD